MTKLDEFQFLHLSVLREYVDMEFREIAPTLPFGYQLERVLDDWYAHAHWSSLNVVIWLTLVDQ